MQKYLEKNTINPENKIDLFGIQSLSDIEIINILFDKAISNTELENLKKIILSKKINIEIIKNKYNLNISNKIFALKELTKRMTDHNINRITSPSEIFNELKNIRFSKQENFILLTLDGANHVIRKRILFKGTLNNSLVHPREIFHNVLKDRSASFIIAHNHPSGNIQPSEEDIELTKRIYKLSEFFGINLLDHIIFSSSNYFSFALEDLIN